MYTEKRLVRCKSAIIESIPLDQRFVAELSAIGKVTFEDRSEIEFAIGEFSHTYYLLENQTLPFIAGEYYEFGFTHMNKNPDCFEFYPD